MAKFKFPTTVNSTEALTSRNLSNTHLSYLFTAPHSSPVVLTLGNAAFGYQFGEISPEETYTGAAYTSTFSITSNVAETSESSNVISFTVSTNNGVYSTLYWTIQGSNVTNSDFSSPSTAVSNGGSVSLVNKTGTFTLTVSADNTTETLETFNVHLRTDSTSGPVVAVLSPSIDISDTSKDPLPFFQGASAGYMVGGSTGAGNVSTYPFASDVDATTITGVVQATRSAAAANSGTHGWYMRGSTGLSPSPATVTKFQFSSSTSSSNFNLEPTAPDMQAGGAWTNPTHVWYGYGTWSSFSPFYDWQTTRLYNLPHAAGSGGMSYLTNLTGQAVNSIAAVTSPSFAYKLGGAYRPGSPPNNSFINSYYGFTKMPFSSSYPVTLLSTPPSHPTGSTYSSAGSSSPDTGYITGRSNTTYKFPFAADAFSALTTGYITAPYTAMAGASSITHSYRLAQPPAGWRNIKFPFANEMDVINVGTAGNVGTDGAGGWQN
jgi:hypothetical protein